ncbi:MAG: rhodanese-like domain-containing protein [Phycisphaerales bacterium JB040]
MTRLTAEELRRLMEERDDLTVINVLPEDSFNEAHIPDSISIPFNEDGFAERVREEVGDTFAKVVVYCANESCDASPKAGSALEEAGFQNVYDFEGGVEAWDEQGYDLGKSKGRD